MIWIPAEARITQMGYWAGKRVLFVEIKGRGPAQYEPDQVGLALEAGFAEDGFELGA